MILYKDENVELSSSEIDNITFLHVEIKELNKSQFIMYKNKFINVLKENNLTNVYSLVVDEKSQRLNEMFGFKPVIFHENCLIMEYK